MAIWFSAEAIQAWRAAPRTNRGGQPRYSAVAIEPALTLRALFRLAFRQTEGLIGSLMQLLRLDLPVPDHTTLSRRARTLAVRIRPQTTGPLHLLVDSTGLKLSGPGEWLVEKHGSKKRRSWRKFHIGVDARTGQIAAVEVTPPDIDDASQVGPLLDQVSAPVEALVGDGAYDRTDVYAAVAARHPEAAVIAPPRADAVFSATVESAPTPRDRHIQAIAETGRMAWHARPMSASREKTGDMGSCRSRSPRCSTPKRVGFRGRLWTSSQTSTLPGSIVSRQPFVRLDTRRPCHEQEDESAHHRHFGRGCGDNFCGGRKRC